MDTSTGPMFGAEVDDEQQQTRERSGTPRIHAGVQDGSATRDARAAELGATLSAIGRELDVPPNLLRSWARRAKERDGGADPAVQSGQQRAPTAEEDVRRLRAENQTLRQERDFLKKASAYFARHTP